MAYPACAAGVAAGAACTADGELCDAALGCGAALICAASDPKLSPGGCPISRARYKTDISYVSLAERAELAERVLALPLATYQYQGVASAPRQLGFIIEDVEPSPSVYSELDRVNLYGYTSMVLAAVQQQQAEIERLQTELVALREQLGAPPRKPLRTQRKSTTEQR